MDFVVGSELEGCFPHNTIVDRHHLREKLINDGFHVNELGYNGGLKYTRWSIHNDSSIRPGPRYAGYELVSPAIPVEQYMDQFVKMTNWCERHRVKTNYSTGFHHGISPVDRNHKRIMSIRGLLLAFTWQKYEDQELASWGRNDNGYCRSLHLRESVRSHITQGDYITNVTGRLGKYRSINFGKLNSVSPYIEVRLMGGPDYLTKYDKILTTLSRVMECMDTTINPTDTVKQSIYDFMRGFVDEPIAKHAMAYMELA